MKTIGKFNVTDILIKNSKLILVGNIAKGNLSIGNCAHFMTNDQKMTMEISGIENILTISGVSKTALVFTCDPVLDPIRFRDLIVNGQEIEFEEPA